MGLNVVCEGVGEQEQRIDIGDQLENKRYLINRPPKLRLLNAQIEPYNVTFVDFTSFRRQRSCSVALGNVQIHPLYE